MKNPATISRSRTAGLFTLLLCLCAGWGMARADDLTAFLPGEALARLRSKR